MKVTIDVSGGDALISTSVVGGKSDIKTKQEICAYVGRKLLQQADVSDEEMDDVVKRCLGNEWKVVPPNLYERTEDERLGDFETQLLELSKMFEKEILEREGEDGKTTYLALLLDGSNFFLKQFVKMSKTVDDPAVQELAKTIKEGMV